MKIHELKTLPEYFEQVWQYRKSFELRKDDRPFEVGDRLRLVEYDPKIGYLNRYVNVEVTSILRNFPGLESGYCIMSVRYLKQTYENN